MSSRGQLLITIEATPAEALPLRTSNQARLRAEAGLAFQCPNRACAETELGGKGLAQVGYADCGLFGLQHCLACSSPFPHGRGSGQNCSNTIYGWAYFVLARLCERCTRACTWVCPDILPVSSHACVRCCPSCVSPSGTERRLLNVRSSVATGGASAIACGRAWRLDNVSSPSTFAAVAALLFWRPNKLSRS
jgi:hypothetical protein